MLNHEYSLLSQAAEDDSSVQKDQHSSNKPGDDQPIHIGQRDLFSPQYLSAVIVVLLVINALCLFATMRQLSFTAQVMKPLLEGRAFLDTGGLPRPDPYYGL